MRARLIEPLLFVLMLIWTGAPHATETAATCQAKSELECINSPECKLASTGNKYVCSQNLDRCEDGFSQNTGTKELCETKNGCVFQRASCYCPPIPNLECRCAGGTPPMCRAT